jgi:hypothetical protein
MWVASVGTQETRTAGPGDLIRPVVEAKARSNHDAPGLRLPTLPHTGVPITLDRRRTDIWETDVASAGTSVWKAPEAAPPRLSHQR